MRPGKLSGEAQASRGKAKPQPIPKVSGGGTDQPMEVAMAFMRVRPKLN